MHLHIFRRGCKLGLALGMSGLLLFPATDAFSQSRPAAGEIDCQLASTQRELNTCAYEEFLGTQAQMAEQLRRLQATYTVEQRAGLRRVQRAWLSFRTESCLFESRQAGPSSAQPMLQWHCAARMTSERVAELVRMANCPEGDLACVRPSVAPEAAR